MFFNQPLIPITEAPDPHSGSVGLFDDVFRNSGKEDHEDDKSAGKSNSHSVSFRTYCECILVRAVALRIGCMYMYNCLNGTDA